MSRAPARITGTSFPSDRGPSAFIHLEGDGWAQGFGGLLLRGKLRAAFMREVRAIFHARSNNDLTGRLCIVCRDEHSGFLTAIEGPHGTFSLHAFQKEHP